ncbi:MAG: hypothetical protein ACOX4T_11765 [Acetivibrionales bacterium]|jgi:hypothetical protein
MDASFYACFIQDFPQGGKERQVISRIGDHGRLRFLLWIRAPSLDTPQTRAAMPATGITDGGSIMAATNPMIIISIQKYAPPPGARFFLPDSRSDVSAQYGHES